MIRRLLNLFKAKRRADHIENAQSVAGLLIELKRGLQSERMAFNLMNYREAKRINGELLKMISSVKMKGFKND